MAYRCHISKRLLPGGVKLKTNASSQARSREASSSASDNSPLRREVVGLLFLLVHKLRDRGTAIKIRQRVKPFQLGKADKRIGVARF